MKSTRTLGPLWLWPVTIIIVGWVARAGWHLRSENETLRTVAAAAGKVDASMGTRATPEPMNGQQEGTVRAEALGDETRREIASREAAEAKIAELESRLPTRDGEVLTSFGRIEEMGRRAGKAVTFLARQAAAQTAAQKPRGKPVTDLDLTKDEQAAFAEFFGQLGELRALENDPREIARFQAATLREVLGLDDATSGRVSAFLEAEFARLKAQQLTANFRPENEPGDWYRRRDDRTRRSVAPTASCQSRATPVASWHPEPRRWPAHRGQIEPGRPRHGECDAAAFPQMDAVGFVIAGSGAAR